MINNNTDGARATEPCIMPGDVDERTNHKIEWEDDFFRASNMDGSD